MTECHFFELLVSNCFHDISACLQTYEATVFNFVFTMQDREVHSCTRMFPKSRKD
jgi:hypothetical protein